MNKIAFLDVVHPVLKEGLERHGWECLDLTRTTLKEIEAKADEFHGIVIRSRFPMDETFLSKASTLQFIARSGAGMENIDESYCQKRGIQLFNAPEGNRNAVGEHALGMLLALFNKLTKGNQEVKNGVWNREGNRGIELDGRTVGIIGYGNNGSAFAKKLRGFDVRVLAYDKYKSGFGDEFVEESTLTEIQNEANVLSLHVPDTPMTRKMINSRFIHQMDHPFHLINLSRGTIVDSAALMDGLEMGKVLGACLDVLEYEKGSFEDFFDETDRNLPTPLRYLIGSDQVILTPHVGGWTEESYYKLSAVLLDKIEAAFQLV